MGIFVFLLITVLIFVSSYSVTPHRDINRFVLCVLMIDTFFSALAQTSTNIHVSPGSRY